MGKRQEAALLTRRKIIDAVKELLSEQSADSINIEDIAERAGVAKGSFYTHFKRKEDVVSVIALESYEVIRETVFASEQNVVENISMYLLESVKIIEKNTLEIAQNWMKSVAAPLASETGGMDKYNYDRKNILAILQKAVAKNELKADTQAESIAQTIMNIYYGAVAVWCITKGEEGLYNAINDFCINTLNIILENYKNQKG